MRRLATSVAWIVLLFGGCVPSVDNEWSCVENFICPPNWICGRDLICRSTRAEWDPCLTNSECGVHESGEPGICAASVDPMAEMDGRELRYCTYACDDDAACVDLFADSPAVCVAGICRPACNGPPDCPDGAMFGCHLGIPMSMEMPPPDPPSGPYCFHLQNQGLDGSRTCTEPPECPFPGTCVRPDLGNGVCTMLCEADPQCRAEMGAAAACVELETGGLRACLRRCDPAIADVCGTGFTCLDRSADFEESVCIPEVWGGLPLTPRMMM